MTLVVETGTGLANADSYVSIADAVSFHKGFGNADWVSLSNTIQEQSLRKATNYMMGEYRLRWLGKRMTEAQALDWPRAEVLRRDSSTGEYLANDAVPQEVKNACCLLALRASTSSLLADEGQRKTSVTVGPISTTYEAGSRMATKYSEVDAMLKPFLSSFGGQIKMVRV